MLSTAFVIENRKSLCHSLGRPSRSDFVQFQLSEAKACKHLEELFSCCDAVSICTPNATHVELAVEALKAGKHVLCEKPFAPLPEDCDEAIKYAKLTGKVAMIGLCYREIPGLVLSLIHI